ncbi:MAG: hypothetical protein LBQ75_06020 [Zoogloeaceae bacterium]|jgi:hypothetical protein|nr:hypothetical protein [Zoogloeaceae bacterium]
MRGLPAFYPFVEYVPHLPREGAIPLRELCGMGGVPCRASGPWIERPVLMLQTAADFPEGRLRAEPGYRSAVEVHVPHSFCDTQQSMARYALCALARSALGDLVSQESIKNAAWARIDPEEAQKPAPAIKPFRMDKKPKGIADMDQDQFATLLSLCRDICADYPGGVVFIGGIAVYLHARKTNPQNTDFTHDADFYISKSYMGALREHEAFTANRRLDNYQIMMQGFEFNIYTEHQATLPVSYDEISAYREEIDGISVACPEHLLALKLEAYASRKGSHKDDKDARDLVNIMLARPDFRPELCAGYLMDRHLELLEGIPRHLVLQQMTDGNAQLVKQLRLSLEGVVEKVMQEFEKPEQANG